MWVGSVGCVQSKKLALSNRKRTEYMREYKIIFHFHRNFRHVMQVCLCRIVRLYGVFPVQFGQLFDNRAEEDFRVILRFYRL